MKKIQSFPLFLFCVVMISACNGQVKPIGKEPLKLLDFNFKNKVSALYPAAYKNKEYEGYYDLPVNGETRMIKTDTTYNNEYDEGKKAIGMEYRQVSSSSGDVLAVVGEQEFNTLNLAATLDGTVKVIGCEVSELTDAETKKFIESLNKKFGNAKKLEGEFMNKFFIYEWEAHDKVFRFSTVFTDEKNAMKIEVDQQSGKMKEGERTTHHEGYFFVINKAYIKDLETLHTGAFVYIK